MFYNMFQAYLGAFIIFILINIPVFQPLEPTLAWI